MSEAFEQAKHYWYSHDEWRLADREATYKFFYTAGLLRAAEICKSKHENMDSRLNYVAGWLDAEAAIRKEAVE